jgi:uncharacterized protein (DUF736 family)
MSLCDDAVQQKFSLAALRHSSRSLRCKIPEPPKEEGVLIDASQRRRAVRCRGRNGRPPASKGTHIMPTIGSFSQDDLFGQEGTLETLTLKTKIKFVPLKDRSEKQPDYRILAGKREIGAAWSRTSKKGSAYLFLKLTDPSQPDPVVCNLYRNASGPAVLWTR